MYKTIERQNAAPSLILDRKQAKRTLKNINY
jgi:hypothetical protein